MTQRHRVALRPLLCALALTLPSLGLVERGALAQVSFGVNNVLQVQAIDNPAANCQGLRDTLSSLFQPSASHRYLIRLEPGNYYCATPLILPRGVVLEGAGERMTRITGLNDSPLLGIVHMVDGTELLNLRVVNTLSSPSSDAIAVSVWEFGDQPTVYLDRALLHSAGFAVSADSALSIKAVNAWVYVSRSDVLSAIRAEADSRVFVSYSDLPEGESSDSTSFVSCRFSTDGLVKLPGHCS